MHTFFNLVKVYLASFSPHETSNPDAVWAIAADIAKSNGGTTLEMLIEARKIIMPTWDQNNQASIKAWEDISSEYATCASGTVTGVIGKDLRPGNIWENRELPALKNIPNITIIVIIDPKTKISTVIFQR